MLTTLCSPTFVEGTYADASRIVWHLSIAVLEGREAHLLKKPQRGAVVRARHEQAVV